MTPHRWPSKIEAQTLAQPLLHWSWWVWLLFALLGTVLLHGCHGPDEDHELFRRTPMEQTWLTR